MKMFVSNIGSTRRYFIIVCSAVLLFLLHKVPYINLLMTPPTIVCILWVLCTVLWQIGERIQFVMAFLLWIAAFLLVLLSYDHAAEAAGNMVYGLMLFGTMRMIQRLSREAQ
jgi:energy-coupling factor transporter transmembrane protein EcfT